MKIAAAIIITVFLGWTIMAAFAGNTDIRCNQGGARYQAMAEGADCSGSEALDRLTSPDFVQRFPSHRRNRPHRKHRK